MNKYEAYIETLVAKVVSEWWQHHPTEDVFCYFRQGDAVAATDEPEGYELALNERLSPAWDKRICAAKVREALRRLPVLPMEMCL